MLNTLCMIQCYHMSLIAGTWELSLHKISLLQSLISEISAKTHQCANCILRSFVSKDINLLMRAFIVYVRPIVEYCSVVDSLSLNKNIVLLIEKVQRRFTKRLHYLGLPSLELRRLHFIYCYKIVFGVVNFVFKKIQLGQVIATRSHAYKLYKPRCINSILQRELSTYVTFYLV